MDRGQKKPPVPLPPAVQRKRKKGAGSDGGGSAAAAGSSISPPHATKKARVAGPKGKAGRGDKGQEDAADGAAREEGRGVDAAEEERVGKVHAGVFSRDLPWLMYGYGDADKPLKETVDLVEEIAIQYITDTVHTAMRAAAARNAGTSSSAVASARKDELKLEDVLFAVRRDSRKVARVQELIRRQQDIENAKRLYKGDGNEDMPTEI